MSGVRGGDNDGRFGGCGLVEPAVSNVRLEDSSVGMAVRAIDY